MVFLYYTVDKLKDELLKVFMIILSFYNYETNKL